MSTSIPASEPSSTGHDHEEGVHFTPRLYRQRYSFVLDYIGRDSTLHSLLDIGCGTGQLLTIGKYRNPHIQLIAGIDILRFEVEEAYFRLKPLSVEYMMFRRETPLHIYLLHGDATRICPCFHQFDVITLIEVIEHLHSNDLHHLVEHVFGHIRPRLVIVTTPNADFNVLFSSMTPGQFRHFDHKFEFTRQQFHHWASQIVHKYMYKVEFHGVGEAPAHEQHRHLGTCTQIAVFHRIHDHDHHSPLHSNIFSQRLSHCQHHELLSFIDYPFGSLKTNETHEQVRYILEMYRLMAMEKARLGHDDEEHVPHDHDHLYLTIPMNSLLDHPRLKQLNITSDELKSILVSLNYQLLNDDRIILCERYFDHHDDNDPEYHTTDQHETIPPQISSHPPEECWD